MNRIIITHEPESETTLVQYEDGDGIHDVFRCPDQGYLSEVELLDGGTTAPTVVFRNAQQLLAGATVALYMQDQLVEEEAT